MSVFSYHKIVSFILVSVYSLFPNGCLYSNYVLPHFLYSCLSLYSSFTMVSIIFLKYINIVLATIQHYEISS